MELPTAAPPAAFISETDAYLVPDRLLRAQEVAELLNVPIGWVREHTRAGNLPCVPLGRYVRYRRSSVLAWLDEQESGGGPKFRKHRPRIGGL